MADLPEFPLPEPSKPYRVATAYDVDDYGHTFGVEFEDAEYTIFKVLDDKIVIYAKQIGREVFRIPLREVPR